MLVIEPGGPRAARFGIPIGGVCHSNFGFRNVGDTVSSDII
jgi:hypothetical protein